MDAYISTLSNPYILHCTGAEKPWLIALNHKYKKEYYFYNKMTAFYQLLRIQRYKLFGDKIKSISIKEKIIFLSRRHNKKSQYKIFGNLIKFDISFKKIKKFIFSSKIKNNIYKLKILGIPVLAKKDTPEKQYIKILGVPVYYKRNNLFELQNQLNTLLLKTDTMQREINNLKNLTYKASFFSKCVADLHYKNLLPYKNIYKDKTVVICGSGPTLNYYKQISDATHIGLNRSFEKENLTLDYIFAWDMHNLIKADSRFYKKIKEYPAKKICGRFLNDELPQIENKLADELNAITLFSSARYNLSLPVYDETIHYDIEKYPLMDFGSVAFGAFHFALYTGAKRIMLVGIDNTLSGYFSKKHSQEFLQVKQILEGWKKVKTFCNIYYPDVEIVSVNPVGLKGIFRDVYTTAYRDEHPEIGM